MRNPDSYWRSGFLYKSILIFQYAIRCYAEYSMGATCFQEKDLTVSMRSQRLSSLLERGFCVVFSERYLYLSKDNLCKFFVLFSNVST